IVLNKVDLVGDAAPLRAMLDEVALAVPVVEASAVTGDGLADLQAALAPGKTVAFIGSSGVGKSSLVNRLLGREAQHVSDIRQDDARGRHTTTRREMLTLPGGAVLIDTPGMRELGLTEDGGGVDAAFADIAELGQECRFNDCRHEGEPGCAVQAALDSGSLSPERWENYRKLQREAAAYEARQDPVLAAERRRHWKMITKSVRHASKVTGKP
ncbi:MAG: ribosome small subunit-dependent GTPase A, partial [Thermomicrobiales bacterium]|nr:ribosome small subunit-dependent GTPase A [Thermomicrobiales bacterium]